MADYCGDPECFGLKPFQNDLAVDVPGGKSNWAHARPSLCEGCGYWHFDRSGCRLVMAPCAPYSRELMYAMREGDPRNGRLIR